MLQDCAAAHRRGATLARAIQERIKAAAEQAEAEQVKPASPSQPGTGPMDTGEPLVGVKRPLVLSAEDRSSLTSQVIQETSDDIEADVGAVVGLFADLGSAGSDDAVKAKVRKLLETATGRAVQAAVPQKHEAADGPTPGSRPRARERSRSRTNSPPSRKSRDRDLPEGKQHS